MADRIFKGRLVSEPKGAFTEASDDFSLPHAGGLMPYDILREVLTSPKRITHANDEVIMLGAGSCWIRITPNGTLEIGESGA